MMENHGVIVIGDNLFNAFMKFETIDMCAKLEIRAKSIGRIKPLSQKHIDISLQKKGEPLQEFMPSGYSSEERAIRREMCELIHRCYDQQLFTSTQGTFSVKLGEDSFVITPYGVDRKYLTVEDLVRIEGGKYRESGKIPSRSFALHKHIYDTQPHVKSIIISHPPNMMAFAVTDAVFDAHTIPESYIALRNVPKMPYGSSFLQPAMFAKIFDKKTPVALVENDCVIVTGSTLLQAFDRLEVAEYSAKALIDTEVLGEMVKIDEVQTRQIERIFKLD
jgi:L-fuculose-phosphate aldolase